jgi:AcrR family transcriptional regulator
MLRSGETAVFTGGVASTAAVRPTRRSRRSGNEVRKQLLDAASAEFLQKGFTAARTASIARKADATEAQLFRYFGSKRGLFREAIFRQLSLDFADFGIDSFAGLQETSSKEQQTANDYITNLQGFLVEHADLLTTLLAMPAEIEGSTDEPVAIDGLQDFFAVCTKVMASRVTGTPPVAPALMARFAFATVLGATLFQHWIFPRGLADQEELENGLATFIVEALRANRAPRRGQNISND